MSGSALLKTGIGVVICSGLVLVPMHCISIMFACVFTDSYLHCHILSCFSVLGSISDTDLRHDILSTLRHLPKRHAQRSKIPGRLSAALCHHTKAVNAINWSPTHCRKHTVHSILNHSVFSPKKLYLFF